MRLWKPVSIADARLVSEEQHECRSGTCLFSNYCAESRSPPQYYNCNFCEREFRSAQALGGHMNVHRRDRALLHLAHSSFATATFHPPDDIALPGEGMDCFLQKPDSPLSSSPDNRSSTTSPFFDFLDNSSANMASHCRTAYSKEAQVYRFGSDAAAYSIPLECNKVGLPPPMSIVGIVEKKRCVDAPSTVRLDLELRLGNTPPSSHFPSS